MENFLNTIAGLLPFVVKFGVFYYCIIAITTIVICLIVMFSILKSFNHIHKRKGRF